MEERFDKQTQERAVLVGLNADCFAEEDTATESTLDELEDLLETAGGFCTGKVLQNRHTPDSHSFIGEGKAQEVRMLAEATQSTMVIFDNELSPGNIRALEEIIGLPVLDRSALILDIFAQRAKTKEGRLQVELAQYKYLLPRLSGMGTSLSRQGGGIGTRGPGETKLESDRRHIRERINRLEEELEQVRKVRSVQRERRMKNSVPVVAIVGYTNAGKSTLLNQLTGAGIPANNRLFDTLDTTSRLLTVSDNLDVILSDTVGFIAKLPHHLVDAFRATLEELEFADLLLHVIDASDPHLEEHIAVVDRLISQLAKPETPVLKCYNKADLVYSDDIPVGKNIVAISAKRGINMDGLLKAIESALNHARHHIVVRLPYAMGGMVETLHDGAQVKKVDYTPEGIEIEAVVDGILYGRLREYIIGECWGLDEYLIPTQFGEAEFVEKKSRFIGRVWPVDTEEEALAKIQEMKKKHYDATHNCWAYIIRDGAVRFSDDGEPGGTAGMPMLQVLQREGLFNVVCVVTRYFGGILLGAGGLVRAYTKGAKIAVDAAGKSMRRVWTAVYVPCPYPFYERVKLEAAAFGGILRKTDFGAEVELELLFPEGQVSAFLEKLTDLSSGTVEGMETGQEYRAFPVETA